MKFITTSDLKFSGREGRVVFEVGCVNGVIGKTKEEVEKTKARFLIRTEWKNLSDDVETLVRISQAEGILDDEKQAMESSWEKTKDFWESMTGIETMNSEERLKIIVNELSESTLEQFIYNYPQKAKELFTDNLGDGRYKMKFYGNNYLNKQIPLESLFTYQDEFIKKGDKIGMWTPNGYMMINNQGKISNDKRIKVFDGDEIQVLDRSYVEKKYPNTYFPSKEKNGELDIKRRVNFAILQNFKDELNRELERLKKGRSQNKLDGEDEDRVDKIKEAKLEVDELDRSLDLDEYSALLKKIRKKINLQEITEDTLYQYNKIKKIDEIGENLNNKLKLYFDCSNNECDIDGMLAIMGITSPLRVLNKEEIEKNIKKYVKPENQNKARDVLSQIFLFNVRKLSILRDHYSDGKEDNSKYAKHIDGYIANSLSLSDSLLEYSEQVKKEEKEGMLQLINDFLKLDENDNVFGKGKDNPTELLEIAKESLEDDKWEDFGKAAVSIALRLQRSYENLPPNSSKAKKLKELIKRMEEIISIENIKKRIDENKKKIETSNKKIEELLNNDGKYNKYLALFQNDIIPTEEIIDDFFNNLLPEQKTSKLKKEIEKNWILRTKGLVFSKKIMVFSRVNIALKNKNLIQETNKLLYASEKFRAYLKENYQITQNIFTIVNNGDYYKLQEAIDKYLIDNPQDSTVRALKKQINKTEFNKFIVSLRETDKEIKEINEKIDAMNDLVTDMKESSSLDNFVNKLKEKDKKRKEKIRNIYEASFVNSGDLNSEEVQIAIKNALEIEDEFTGITLIEFDKKTHQPVYRIGRTKQIITVNEENKMRPVNINKKETMIAYQEVEAKPENLPVLQIFSAIARANKMTLGTANYKDTNATRSLGKTRTANMIRQIYPWGAQRPLSDNEVTGWAYAIDRVGSIDKFWKIMGATYDKDGGLIDEKGKDIRFHVMMVIEASRNNNFDWLNKYEEEKQQKNI